MFHSRLFSAGDTESAKSLPKGGVRQAMSELDEAANLLMDLQIEMVGARGFEPRTPTVSR